MANQTKTHKITHYRLLDHGIENSQYFQGCGVAFTDYDDVATGCGDNFAEALDDALEMIAQQEDSVDLDALESLIREDENWPADKPWPETPSATAQFQKHNPEAHDEESDEWDMDGCELYYYVSIQYSIDKEGDSNVG